LLAILPNAPNYYSPIRNPEVAQKQHWRLVRQLVRLGYADPEEAERDFQAFWIGYLRTAQSRESVAWNVRVDNAPHFTEYIRQRMFQKYGEKKLYGEGLRIYTTLDLTMQRYADDAVKSALSDVSARYTARKRSLASAFTGRVADVVDLASLLFGVRGMEVGAAKSINQVRTVFEDDLRDGIQMLGPLFNMNGLEDLMFAMRSKGRENSAGAEKVEGALVAIEPSTGKIRAMVGGGEFNSANQLNRAVQMRRQAGSSFKPFIYAAAIDSGRFTAGSSMEDSPIVYFDKEGREWIPNNYGGEYLGFVTLRKALEKSINIVSIKIADTIGLRSVIETSSRLLHLISDAERVRRIRRDLSLALGTMEVSPLEMATGFAIFANQGRDVVPYSIKQVKDRNDHLLEDEESALQALPRRQILTPQVAFIISDMLRSVLEPGGTAYDAIKNTGFKYEAYGKTGTTDNWKDAWFIGFTPELATAVWVGFDDYSLSLGVHNTGGQIAAPIWSSFMYRALTEYPQVTKITRPDGVVSVRICARSGMLPTSACREVIDENFITGSEPGDSCELCAADSTRYETRDISTEMLKKRKSNYKFLK
jgi:penicillin-binding protein 1A